MTHKRVLDYLSY